MPQQLLTDWVTFVEDFWWNRDVIHGLHPPKSVSNEEPFPRNVRFVAVAAMPEPPVKEDRITGFATDRNRAFGKGAVGGFIDRLTEVASGNNIEISPQYRNFPAPVPSNQTANRQS